MANPLFEIEIIWHPESSSCAVCHGCNEPIYSTTYRMYTKIGSREDATEVVLCESCHSAATSFNTPKL